MKYELQKKPATNIEAKIHTNAKNEEQMDTSLVDKIMAFIVETDSKNVDSNEGTDECFNAIVKLHDCKEDTFREKYDVVQ